MPQFLPDVLSRASLLQHRFLQHWLSHHRLSLRLSAFFIALCAAAIFTTPTFAQTNTITVTTFLDEVAENADCSLREAVLAATTDAAGFGCVAGGSDDLILLDVGIYALTIVGDGDLQGDIDILDNTGSITIQGAGTYSTTIDAGGIDRAFQIVSPSTHVTLLDLTIQNGYLVSPAESGGALLNTGNLTITSLLVQNNVVSGTSSSNVGGAICNGCGLGTGNMVISNTVIQNNYADRGGGVFSNTYMTITNSSIVSNSARVGGGIMSYVRIDKSIVMDNSTVSGNRAIGNGGGISQNSGTFTITNSSIISNSAPSSAGVILGDGKLAIRNSLLSNHFEINCAFWETPIVSLGHNLSSDDSCMFTAEGDQNEIDAKIGPLGYYGGHTPTHTLRFGSPAIDAGDAAACPNTDQRGVARPQLEGCDIGAFEYDGPNEPEEPEPPVVDLLFLPTLNKATNE